MSEDKALTAQEVADILRVSVKTVRAWLDQGDLAGFKLPGGGEWRIWQSTLERFYPRSAVRAGDATAKS